MMLRVKDGVKLYGLQPEMLWAIDRINECYDRIGKDCTITSGRGDRHSSKSRHYPGHAVDARTRHLTEAEKLEVKVDIQETLGPQFDVILESTHLHVEFDPKMATEYLTKLPT